jgi:hypothetical protein
MGNPNIIMNIGLIIVKEIVYKGSFRYGVSAQGSGIMIQTQL